MDIRKALDIPHSTLTSAINRLEKRGFLKRVITQQDRRSYSLRLTKKGEQVQTEHHRVDIMLADKLLEALDTNKERVQLIRLLAKISNKLG
jgi:DNA-binding MarR family transcriptional regulator